MSWSPDTYKWAYRFAAEAHLGQPYPGTKLPYIMHLSFVSVEMIAALQREMEPDADFALQCALLHDVIEDTQVSYQALEAEFGEQVAQGVQALTKNPALPPEESMQDSLGRIKQQPHEVWMVKLADRITNLAPPPGDWDMQKIKGYRLEALDIHAALHEASPYLAQRLAEKIEAYSQYL